MSLFLLQLLIELQHDINIYIQMNKTKRVLLANFILKNQIYLLNNDWILIIVTNSIHHHTISFDVFFKFFSI